MKPLVPFAHGRTELLCGRILLLYGSMPPNPQTSMHRHPSWYLPYQFANDCASFLVVLEGFGQTNGNMMVSTVDFSVVVVPTWRSSTIKVTDKKCQSQPLTIQVLENDSTSLPYLPFELQIQVRGHSSPQYPHSLDFKSMFSYSIPKSMRPHHP